MTRSTTLPRAVLFDLLMAVLNSLGVWEAAAGDRRMGLSWRDAVTARMAASDRYRRYEELVTDAAHELQLSFAAPDALFENWRRMEPWPDAAAIRELDVPYAFVTNTSKDLALSAAHASGLSPQFTLSAEEAGCYKPDARIYRRACAMLGVAAEETLFVAGSPYDAVGAHEAGLPSVLVRRRPDQPLPGPSIPTIDTLAEVRSLLDPAHGPAPW